MTKFKSKVSVKPLRDCVVIQRKEIDAVTDGGIIMPTEVLEARVNEGVIVKVGNKVEELEVGNYVIFGEYTAKNISAGGLEFVVVSEEDVFCVLEGK